MRKKLYAIVIGIIVLVYSFSVDSIAEGSDELQEKRKIAQDKITENTVKLDSVQIEITDLMAEIQELSDDIYEYEVEVAILDKEISDLNVKLDNVEKQLNEIETKYNKRKKLLAERVIERYEAGDVAYLDFLLNSNGLIEFVSNYYLIGEIIDFDLELIDDYEKQKEQVESVKDELDKFEAELKEKKEAQEKSAIVLENKKTIKNNQMVNLSEEQRVLQDEIDEYQKEVQEIEVELLIMLTANLDSDYVGGTLAWPVPGHTSITSNYGMRVHPISKIYRLHTGVDIAAPLGAYFIAANDGTVVTSRYSASYGNVVVIDHGGGLSTLYAHGEERLVEVGDKVTRGEPVLKVGSTGISTGPHAHFEVRVNGVWVEPLDYILKRSTTNETEEVQENE